MLGAASLLVVCASLGWAAYVIRRRFAPPEWSGALARLAEVVIGFALLTALLEVLGAIRLFRLAPIVIASLLVGLGTSRVLAGDGAADARAARGSGAVVRRRPASTAYAVAAGIAVLGLLAEWAGPTFSSFDFGIRSFDSVWYHLPWAASFAQTGQITGLRFTDVEYLTAFYPATAEMFHGAGIVLLSRDTLSPVFNLLWLGLLLLAAYCVGRPRGVGWLTMLGAAIGCAVPMFVGSQGGSAANDIVGVFFVVSAAALFVNAEGDAAFPLVLGGIAAGLAIGTKLSMVVPAVALTIGVSCPRAPALVVVGGAVGGRRRLLVPAEPDRGRQSVPVGEPARAGDTGGAAAGAHRVQRRPLSVRRPRLECVFPAGIRFGARRLVVGGPRLVVLGAGARAAAGVRRASSRARARRARVDRRLPDHSRDRGRTGGGTDRVRVQPALRGTGADPVADRAAARATVPSRARAPGAARGLGARARRDARRRAFVAVPPAPWCLRGARWGR